MGDMVSFREWSKARAVFVNSHKGLNAISYRKAQKYFDEYVGHNFPVGWHAPGHLWKMANTSAGKIASLNGPHGNTIARMWIIQKFPKRYLE